MAKITGFDAENLESIRCTETKARKDVAVVLLFSWWGGTKYRFQINYAKIDCADVLINQTNGKLEISRLKILLLYKLNANTSSKYAYGWKGGFLYQITSYFANYMKTPNENNVRTEHGFILAHLVACYLANEPEAGQNAGSLRVRYL